MLDVFATDATVAVLADWVEASHLVGGLDLTTDSVIRRGDRATTADPEHGEAFDADSGEMLDVEIIDDAMEDRRQRVYLELQSREDALGDAYPFSLAGTSGGGWSIATRRGGSLEARIARLGYNLALLMASIKHQHIVKQDEDPEPWVDLEKQIADRFQALAVLAANNIFGPRTEVYWLGFPRPDHTGFLTALPKLIEKLGHGTVRDRPPYGKENDQDATVDLVAWRPFSDRTFGTIILFGQVASGNDWDGKSIHGHLADRFFEHFSEDPTKHFLGATFMPFVSHTNTKVPRDGRFDAALVDNARAMEIRHGLLLDRIRITELLAAGIADDRQRHNAPSPCSSARDAFGWIKRAKAYCGQRS